MATKELITPQQYLSTHFEREPEYVHGELVEKSLPTKSHSRIQQRLSVLLDRVGCCYPELRVQIADDAFRIPGIALFETEPAGEVPNSPPLLIIEIASPDDKMHDLLEKFEEYRAWGVPHICMVEPELKKLYVYDRGLKEMNQLELGDFAITPAELFS
ncbi:MAG TPA: Uma2 family endonuclease [Bryobacteraceae bacterium]|nr:Uma2 family endonuclease [Bryobacteraceae bacterium]